MDFLVERKDPMATPGSVLTFKKLNALSLEGALTETSDLEPDAIASGSDATITVGEYGKALGVSRKYDVLGFLRDDQFVKLLAQNYARQMNAAARDAIAGCTNIIYGGAAASLATIPNSSAGYFNWDCVSRGVETIEGYEAIPFNLNGDEFFICFIHTHQKATLKRDPNWVSAAHYGAPEQRFKGEVGRIDNVRFIATNMCRNGAAAATHPGYASAYHDTCTPSGIDGYEALLIGEGAAGMAVASDVIIATEASNFGRKVGIAWLRYIGFGLIEDNHCLKIATI
jgi:N4-gp56 family major capsid protein